MRLVIKTREQCSLYRTVMRSLSLADATMEVTRASVLKCTFAVMILLYLRSKAIPFLTLSMFYLRLQTGEVLLLGFALYCAY
jgi:hypothetical protein